MEATSKHIFGTSELTCLMPIKQGFVDVFETRTFATRLRITMRVLHGLRLASREMTIRVFPDVVDLIRAIHSFQLVVINESQLLLAVTFDRPWEPYIRLVWKGLGPLLDPLLINCVGYETHASDKGFDRFAEWVRKNQVDAGLFYAGSSLTVDDARYLTQLERLQRQTADPAAFDKIAATFVPDDLEKEAATQAANNPKVVVESGLKALSALYGLREYYPEIAPSLSKRAGPADPSERSDAYYLRRAAQLILKRFDPSLIPENLQTQFAAELAWLNGPVGEGETPPLREPQHHEMQGGILPKKKDGVGPAHRTAHGALLLIRVVDAATARKFLRRKLNRFVTSHRGDGSPKDVYTNVAFTFNGLKRLEVPDSNLAHFPMEFREGMEARAGLLGDVQSNHPTKWSLPELNWPDPQTASKAPVPVSTIDIVVKLRAARHVEPVEHEWTDRHPLHAFATELFRGGPIETGVQVMSVQPMFNHVKDGKVIDHFDSIDAISQPEPRADRNTKNENWDNEVSLGDLFLGYRSDRHDPPFLDKQDPDVLPGREVGSLLDNGTFLVVRKLHQDVPTFEKFLGDNKGKHAGLDREALRAKMLGRDAKGNPLAAGWDSTKEQNDFDYRSDKGEGCPLHAHVRRANPRDGRVPRIMRRGMSYGSRYQKGAADAGADRGLIFLAYNASIAEQFEAIQRWMTGGNSTGGFSGEGDPFLRVPQPDACGIFRFVDKGGEAGKVVRLNLDDAMVQQGRDEHGIPMTVVTPFVKLQWGMYLFVPSMSALEKIAGDPQHDVVAEKETIALGEKVIASLATDDHWRAILEDVTPNHSGITAAVYAALRARGGVHRTLNGGMVLVATEQLVLEVLRNKDFSVSQYRSRMKDSIGEIYLGLDAGPAYSALSDLNQYVSAITQRDAFVKANDVTTNELTTLLDRGDRRVTLALDKLADTVLAELSRFWFGVPNGKEIKTGGRPVPGSNDVHLPHHSLPPSRYIFSSPLPRPIVTLAGERSGQALRKAVTELAHNQGISAFNADLSRDVWNWIEKKYGRPDPELFGRMLVGLIEGFLPTVYGNFLKTVHLWLSEETLWRVQQDLRRAKAKDANLADYHYRHARHAIEPELKCAMQRRPVPDVIYRTAAADCTLGGTAIKKGERVVLLLGSATQQIAAEERAGTRPAPAHPRESTPNVMPIFGGNRGGPNPPTHACPAHDMGMGVLLGMFSALLEAGSLSPTGSPLSVTLSRPDPAGAGGGQSGGGGATAGQLKSVQTVASANSCPWH
jgi:Dyp-type peroxidase family